MLSRFTLVTVDITFSFYVSCNNMFDENSDTLLILLQYPATVFSLFLVMKRLIAFYQLNNEHRHGYSMMTEASDCVCGLTDWLNLSYNSMSMRGIHLVKLGNCCLTNFAQFKSESPSLASLSEFDEMPFRDHMGISVSFSLFIFLHYK